MVANLLHGVTLYRLDAWLVLEALAVLVLAAVGPVALPRLGPLGGTAVAAVVALAAAAGAHAGYRRGAWLLVVGPLLALVVGHVTSLTYELLTEGRERRWIKQAFRLYVPPAVVEEIGRNPGQLAFGGERRVLTVLFTDLRGFTTFSEARPPEEVVATLREYLTEMSDVVFRHRGTLDKFMGDAIMAFFGAPFENADHAFQACQAALEMADRLDQLNARWREAGREPLAMGIGITTGEVLVGNFGSSQRFTYTVVGDQVNLGARLESLNKEYPTERHIIISETTYQAVRDRVATRPLGQVTVKGKHVAVEVFELVGLAPPAAAPATGGAPAAAVARTSGT
jgi:adenylate cyclase